MNLTHKPIYEAPPETIFETINRAFTGYIGGDLHLDVITGQHFLHTDTVHPALSKLALVDDEPAGVALVSRTGWNSRLAAMGIVPEKTNKGIGAWLMNELIDEAYQRGDRTYTLEVIEQNEPAVRLYESCGFRIVRRLYGYTSAANLPTDRDKDLQEVDLVTVTRALYHNEPEDMPWQAAGMTISRLSPPTQGFQLGPAYAAVSPGGEDTKVLRSLVVEQELRGLGHASRLLRALFALYPDHSWKIPAYFPGPPKGRNLFTRLGFETGQINQFQMLYHVQ
jgi:GNAT superfamily N-acetyltransferase